MTENIIFDDKNNIHKNLIKKTFKYNLSRSSSPFENSSSGSSPLSIYPISSQLSSSPLIIDQYNIEPIKNIQNSVNLYKQPSLNSNINLSILDNIEESIIIVNSNHQIIEINLYQFLFYLSVDLHFLIYMYRQFF